MFTVKGKKLCVDKIETTELPLIRIIGWYDSVGDPDFYIVNTYKNKDKPLGIYRTMRKDVVNAGESRIIFNGFICEFYEKNPLYLLLENKKIEIPGAEKVGKKIPHYEPIFHTNNILKREDIYSYGPPTDVSEEVLEICGQLEGKILDFGCGNGDLISKLRNRNMDAFGIELNSERIKGRIKPEMLPYVQMYDGNFPLPFEEKSFDYLTAIEVLEHIPNVEDLPKEFFRIAKKGLLVTVPDITSIPTGFLNGVVPWHLLESTHVNFFTIKSIVNLFKEYFRPVKYYRVGNLMINNILMPGSVGVRFEVKMNSFLSEERS